MARRPGSPLTIDCGTCPVQHVGCADCMVTALMGPTVAEPVGDSGPGPQVGIDMPLDRRERTVVSRLVAAGLVSVDTANGARAVHEPRSRYEEVRRHAG